MTINEAIEHLEQELSDKDHDWGCEKCRQEHEQLLEWLKENVELKRLLKLAVDDIEYLVKIPYSVLVCEKCKYRNDNSCQTENCLEQAIWLHAEEALKQIGGDS